MATAHNASEVYDIGILIEKNGKRFYEEAAAVQEDHEFAKFFNALAKWEGTHVALWKDLKQQLSESPQETSPYDSDDQVQRHLEATADNHVFVKNTNILSLVLRCKTIEDVLKLAMAFERDSVHFYEALSEATPAKWGKEKIDARIQEERQHIARIQEKLDRLG